MWADGAPLRLGGERQRALLALLLLHANEVVPSDRLVEQLFGLDAPESAANALQVAVSRLRRLLGDGVLVTRPRGYLLQVEPGQLDAALFEQLLAGRPPRARRRRPVRRSGAGCARGWRCGAGRRWPIWRRSRPCSRTSAGSRSCTSPR